MRLNSVTGGRLSLSSLSSVSCATFYNLTLAIPTLAYWRGMYIGRGLKYGTMLLALGARHARIHLGGVL